MALGQGEAPNRQVAGKSVFGLRTLWNGRAKEIIVRPRIEEEDRKVKKIFVLTLLALLLAAVAVVPTFAEGKAMVRVVHASPDAPAVDVYVNGNAAFTNLTFPNATDYAELAPGTYNINVFASSAKGAGTPAIAMPNTTLEAKPYTVVAIGKLADIKPLVLVDNLTKPAAGKAHVRFVHASPDAPAVDITTSDGTVLFPNIAFGKATDFTPVAAGTYHLQARAAGTTTVALDVPGVQLQDGGIYTIFATGLLNGSPKLAATVVTYQAAVPTLMPTTGASESQNGILLAMIAAGLVLMGLGWGLSRQAGR